MLVSRPYLRQANDKPRPYLALVGEPVFSMAARLEGMYRFPRDCFYNPNDYWLSIPDGPMKMAAAGLLLRRGLPLTPEAVRLTVGADLDLLKTLEDAAPAVFSSPGFVREALPLILAVDFIGRHVEYLLNRAGWRLGDAYPGEGCPGALQAVLHQARRLEIHAGNGTWLDG